MPFECPNSRALPSGGQRGSRGGRCPTLVSQGLAQLQGLARGDLEGHSRAPPPPACWGRAAAALDGCWVLIYKKGEPLNRLRFLEPKRQDLSADRQDQSGDRQKPLVLLSAVCQVRDSQTTNTEEEKDGRSTESGGFKQPDYHQAWLPPLPDEPECSDNIGPADPH